MAKVVSIAKKPAEPNGKKQPKGTRKSAKRSARPELVHRFLIVLTGTDPVIWRRIEVPETYSFWDLHVAIQDAMGWLDCHLHEFRLLDAAERKVVSIGIPTGEESADRPVLPGWKVPVSQFFERREWHSPPATYAYDFGDDWEHVFIHEGLEPADESRLSSLRVRRRSVSARGLRRSARIRRVLTCLRRSNPRAARVDGAVGRGGLRPGGLQPGDGKVR